MDKKKQSIGSILENLPGKMVLVTGEGTVLARKDAGSDSSYREWPAVSLFSGTDKACRLHWLSPEGGDPALTRGPLELLLRDLIPAGSGFWFRHLLTEKPETWDFGALPAEASSGLPCSLGALRIGRGTAEEAAEALRVLLPDMKAFTTGPGFLILRLPAGQEGAQDWSESILALLEEELMMDPLLLCGEAVEAPELLYLHREALESLCNRLFARGVRGMGRLMAHLPELAAARLIEDPSRLFRDMGRIIRPVLMDPDLSHTASAFIQTNLSVSETAQVLFLHRNTLVYRLGKIEKLTGLDLKRLDHAMAFIMLKAALGEVYGAEGPAFRKP